MPKFLPVPSDLDWRSARCDGGACVRVARRGEEVLFGNTTLPGGPVNVYTRDEWEAFLAGVKRGEFDNLF